MKRHRRRNKTDSTKIPKVKTSLLLPPGSGCSLTSGDGRRSRRLSEAAALIDLPRKRLSGKSYKCVPGPRPLSSNSSWCLQGQRLHTKKTSHITGLQWLDTRGSCATWLSGGNSAGVDLWDRWEVRADREALTHRCPLSRPKQTATQAVSHSQSCDQKHISQAGRATEAEGVKTVWGLLSGSGVVMLSRLLSFGPPPFHFILITA